MVLLRGAFFRIGHDGVLRGPDNAPAARYAAGSWRFARNLCRILECRDSAYLRVTHLDGSRRCIGPYEGLRVTGGGAIFANDTYLGTLALGMTSFPEAQIWREITILSAVDDREMHRAAAVGPAVP